MPVEAMMGEDDMWDEAGRQIPVSSMDVIMVRIDWYQWPFSRMLSGEWPGMSDRVYMYIYMHDASCHVSPLSEEIPKVGNAAGRGWLVRY